MVARFLLSSLVTAALCIGGFWFVLDRALTSQDSNISSLNESVNTQREVLSERLNQLEVRLQDITAADGQQSEAITTLKGQQGELIDLVESTSAKLSTLSLALKARSEDDRKYLANLGVSMKGSPAGDYISGATAAGDVEMSGFEMKKYADAGWSVVWPTCGAGWATMGKAGTESPPRLTSEQKIERCINEIRSHLKVIEVELQK